MVSPPPHTHRDPALDGLRGLAVLMVFVQHYAGTLDSHRPALRTFAHAAQAGWIGLILFFALSGFLITGSLWSSFSQPGWLQNFYARRALRIFPLYFAVLLAVLIFAIGSGARFSELHAYAIYAFFLQNLPVLVDKIRIAYWPFPLYHLWTVAVAVQFYLLWPALLYLAYRKGAGHKRSALHLCLWTFAFAEAFRLLIYGFAGFKGYSNPHVFDTILFTHAGALALGGALALALRNKPNHAHASAHDRIQQWATTIFLAGLGVFAVASWHSSSCSLSGPLQYTVALPAVSVAAAALIALALHPGRIRSTLAFTPFTWLGRISYGFYIFHILLQPFFDAFAEDLTHAATGTLFQTTRFLVALPLTTLVAWLSFYFLELAFLQQKQRFPMHQPLPPA